MKVNEIVRRASLAIDSGDDTALVEVLAEVGREGSSVELATSLLTLLREESEAEGLHHQMFAVVHALERLVPGHYYRALASSLGRLRRQSLEWSETIVARLLAARRDQGRGFDFRDFLRALEAHGSRQDWEALSGCLAGLESDDPLLQEAVEVGRSVVNQVLQPQGG